MAPRRALGASGRCLVGRAQPHEIRQSRIEHRHRGRIPTHVESLRLRGHNPTAVEDMVTPAWPYHQNRHIVDTLLNRQSRLA